MIKCAYTDLYFFWTIYKWDYECLRILKIGILNV